MYFLVCFLGSARVFRAVLIIVWMIPDASFLFCIICSSREQEEHSEVAESVGFGASRPGSLWPVTDLSCFMLVFCIVPVTYYCVITHSNLVA